MFNLVTGTGPVVGEAIAAHPDIDMVSFTGSTRAGKRVAEVASQTLKRVALELGGKSANILLDDLDDEGFEKCVRDGVGKAYLNQGQTCTALTRMLVPNSRMADAERIAADEVETKFQPKDPFADFAMMGPLSSRRRSSASRATSRRASTRAPTSSSVAPRSPKGVDADGYFVQPTVFSQVRNDMTIAQEEIFGPVLSIIGYEDEEDAVRIANDSALRPVRWRAGRRRRAGQEGRPPHPHRPDRGQRRCVQPDRPVRWLQEQRLRP